MCEPTTIIAGLAVATTAIKAGSDILQAAGQNKQSAENKIQAEKAYKLQVQALSTNQMQVQQAGRQSILQADMQARQASATAAVSAGEAGVTGASVDAILAGIERDRLTYGTGVDRQTKATVDQLQLEKQGAMAARDARIAGLPQANPFVTGLKIGGDVLGGIGDYERIRSMAKG